MYSCYYQQMLMVQQLHTNCSPDEIYKHLQKSGKNQLLNLDDTIPQVSCEKKFKSWVLVPLIVFPSNGIVL